MSCIDLLDGNAASVWWIYHLIESACNWCALKEWPSIFMIMINCHMIAKVLKSAGMRAIFHNNEYSIDVKISLCKMYVIKQTQMKRSINYSMCLSVWQRNARMTHPILCSIFSEKVTVRRTVELIQNNIHMALFCFVLLWPYYPGFMSFTYISGLLHGLVLVSNGRINSMSVNQSWWYR